jgi:hypothetical protein
MQMLVTTADLQARMATGPVPLAEDVMLSALQGAHLRIQSELDTNFAKGSYSDVFFLDETKTGGVIPDKFFRCRLSNGLLRPTPAVVVSVANGLEGPWEQLVNPWFRVNAPQGYVYVYQSYCRLYVKVDYLAGYEDADVVAGLVQDEVKEAILAYAPTVMDFSSGTEPAKKNVGQAQQAALAHATAVMLPIRRTLGLYMSPIWTGPAVLGVDVADSAAVSDH